MGGGEPLLASRGGDLIRVTGEERDKGMVLGIVLAGRPNLGALRAVSPEVAWEAMVPIAGRPMASYVVAALAGARPVERVVVAGPDDLAGVGVEVSPPGQRVTDSLRGALDRARQSGCDADELVVATGDAPLLTAGTVAALIEYCRRRDLSFGYPIIARAACEARFPGVRRTYVRICEGVFTGGNCFYLRAGSMARVLELLEQVHAHRKHPMRLARMFGWDTVLGVLTGTARLARLEAVASRLLGCAAGAWVCPDPGAGVDADDPGDLEICRAALERAPAQP